MNTPEKIASIYDELTMRYDRISVSTIKSVLKGKLKVQSGNVTFCADTYSAPCLEEAEDAFKKYNCAIFTAFRGGYTLEENLERNARLKADMKDCGMRFRPVNGCYREADWEYPCVEYCFFVINSDYSQSQLFFEIIYSLAAKYEQDSFLYKRAGINRTAFLVATTEAGRKDLHGNIKFAGQLYLDVPDVEAWTECHDGRFAFQLKGMIYVVSGKEKISIGEGSIFDIEGYCPDGIVVIRSKDEKDLMRECKSFKSANPDFLIKEYYFKNDNQTEELITSKVWSALNSLKNRHGKLPRRIGFHCSASICNSRVNGAKIALEAVKTWLDRNRRRIDLIVVVDTYGDYCNN